MLDPLQFYCRVLCNGMKTRFRMVMIAHPGPGIGFHKRFMWRIIIPPTPCLENMWVRNNLTTCRAFTVSWEGMNITCFIKQSTTTRIAEKPLEAGSCSMKSIEMDDHGWEGIGSCFNFP